MPYKMRAGAGGVNGGIRGGKERGGATVKGGRGGEEKVLFIYFCTGCGGSLYMPKH